MRRLRRMLDKVVSDDEASVRERLRSTTEARILDIACGACNEAEVLADFVADLKGNEPGAVKFTGVDIRRREIENAKRRFGGKHLDSQSAVEKEFEFISGDATRLDGHSELGENFDLVFLRHQNYWNGARDWEEIFDQALGKLDEEGRLVITSYFDREHELALEAIGRLGGKLVRSEFNSETRELPTKGKSIDRHVAIFRKTSS